MGRVVGLLSAGEVLGSEEFEVVANREDLRLRVEVIHGRGVVATSHETQSAILYHLEAADGGI